MVCINVNGPCYETIMEMGMAKSYGADALGMSTAYEGMFLTTASLRNSYVTYT